MKKNYPIFIVMFLSFSVLYSFMGVKNDSGYEVEKNPQWSNLQILPQDISEEALEHVMKSFSEALGVKCSFCHVVKGPKEMDWASDDKMQKEISRGMMKMTADLNMIYFNKENPAEYKVNCYTCHNGNEKPLLSAPIVEEAAEAVVEEVTK